MFFTTLVSSSAQNLLDRHRRLGRPTISRRHGDLDCANWTHLFDIPGRATVMMPLRARTRGCDRGYRIAAVRRDNQARIDEQERQRQLEIARLIANDQPPPF